ncbi:prepilin-type N-terminal cleavage/methylation domain-containing protein [Thermus caliditerrae]|uniref:prepilin-type N-terminal cleavage/methylation domain-containing protein n=1 Tax=Thermus caliditerrae TaxID=1330700 RepID=UPI00056FB2DB|nr:prepilin-type N-terminal cleavage/methylation domain-containing protein [Thermus caliditerrae]
MRKGFTLLEILVAIAVLGIFTAALLSFMQSTLAANRTARVQAQLLEELKDAAGYLADTLQEAKAVLTSAQVNGQTCAPPSCLAVLVPESVTSCALRAYRLENRSAVGNDYKAPDPWADANTRMLREYRLGGQSCTATSFTNAQPYVVLDLVDNDSNLSFFQVDTNPTRITLNIRLKARERTRIVYVPGNNQAYQVRIYPRNAP